MKKTLAKTLALLLALCMIPLAACSSGTDNAAGDAAAADGQTAGQNDAAGAVDPEADAAADAEAERIRPDIPETADFGGDEIYFVVWELADWADTVRQFRDIYAEGITGEAINDAV